jgi:hypothetical protein
VWCLRFSTVNSSIDCRLADQNSICDRFKNNNEQFGNLENMQENNKDAAGLASVRLSGHKRAKSEISATMKIVTDDR